MRGRATTVSQHTLIQRLNRALAHEGEFLKKTNPRRVAELGPYFIADIASNLIVRENVNLEELAREKGVLATGEKVEAEDEINAAAPSQGRPAVVCDVVGPALGSEGEHAKP